jgi:DNA-binding transcriptional MerR regulator
VRPNRRVSGHRRYEVDAVDAVGVIRFFQEVGFTLAETKRLLASRKRSPSVWRDLAVRKSEELRHRMAKEDAARHALEHALVCPKEDFLDCDNFWRIVRGVLAGVELADAHASVHATAHHRSPGDERRGP